MMSLILAAAGDARAATDEYANIHTVAVISALGNEVETTTLGFTRFGTSDYDLRTDWDLDQEAVATAGKLLQARFTVKNVAVDPLAFASIKHGVFDDFYNDVGRRVVALPKGNGVDAYVVVFPNFGVQMGDQNHGLFIMRDTDSSGTAVAVTNYLVGVFDAATGGRIDWGTAQYPERSMVFGRATPMATCPNTMWGEDPNQLPIDRQAQMRPIFAWLVDKDIGFALASANLIPKADAEAAAAQNGAIPNPACHEGLP